VPVLVAIVLLCATAGGYVIARQAVDSREQQALGDAAEQTVTVISSFGRQIEAILTAGSIVAEVTAGDPVVFERQMRDRVEGTAITSISLVRLDRGKPEALATAGEQPPLLLSTFGQSQTALLERIASSKQIRVIEITELGGSRVVGFATSGGTSGRYAVYAESVIPALERIFTFSLSRGTQYALYIGKTPAADRLIQANTADLPLQGEQVVESLKLGSQDATLVVAAAGSLVSWPVGAGPWLVIVLGVILSLGAALGLEIARRRAAGAAERRALEDQNTRLRELDRLKDELVATVSHELRTPLTSILGYLELILEDGDELSEEHRNFVEVIDRNARRLLGLVGDLLFIARIDAGGLQLEVDVVDLEGLARECVEAQRPRAEQAGLSLELTSEEVAPMHGDRARLGQLLDNLVSNAIKFTPTGGRVDVRLCQADGTALLEVADTGIGIPDDEQGRLFERFFRSSTATESAIQGTGLGLAISKAIAEAHGGTISAESQEGVGTTFRVELPLEARLEARRENRVTVG
jgi:signal transduction histidine kinase